MNIIDKAIAVFAPGRALSRARARAALKAVDEASRLYEAAAPGRRANSWRARGLSQNSEMWGALAPLRNRARNMARNSPWAPRLLDILVAHTVGTGLRPVVATGNEPLDRRVMELWEEWNVEADVEGALSFDAMQALALRSTIESGEVVFRYINQPLKKNRNSGSPVPLKLQMLEADFIDHQRDGIGYYDMGPGLTSETKRSRLGVGLGEWDKRTGLWLFPRHPGEYTTGNLVSLISTFVQQEEVQHMFWHVRPGQVRGVSWFAPMLLMSGDLADYMDAQVMKAKIEACFAAFVTNSNEYEEIMTPSQATAGFESDANPDAEMTTLEPGMIKELKQGQDIKFAQPTQASQVEPMMMFPLMAMAAAVGATYDQISGDLRGANYSSLRAGKIDFRARVQQLQRLMVIPNMCLPIWRRFIERAIMAGVIEDRNYPVRWVTPAWESINPKFDQNAEELSVRAGRMTPQEFIAEWGSDWRQVQDDFAEFYKRADKLGLKFDIDPRQMTKAGTFQKAAGEGGGFGAADGSDQQAQDIQDLIDSKDESDSERMMLQEFIDKYGESDHHSAFQPRDGNGKWMNGKHPNRPPTGGRIAKALEAAAKALSAAADAAASEYDEWTDATMENQPELKNGGFSAQEGGRGVPFRLVNGTRKTTRGTS